MATASEIVLVHGAWADGSSWAKVIPLLAEKGLSVTAVQLPLTSFEADVETVRRAIALADGDVVLVGHSYGGAVISEAGNDPKVVRMAYIDAFAPDAGESVGMLVGQIKVARLDAEIRPDADGYLQLSRTGIFDLFVQDLNEDEKAVAYATQGSINGASLGSTVTQAAWRTRPTFYLIGTHDHAIPQVEQERMAARMNATVTHVNSSHVPMLSQPVAVAQFIVEAAE